MTVLLAALFVLTGVAGAGVVLSRDPAARCWRWPRTAWC